jgi:hypothetical protein
MHPQIPLDPDKARFPAEPWPAEVDIWITEYMSAWLFESHFKSQQIRIPDRTTPVEGGES